MARSTPAHYIAYTAPINPADTTPRLTRRQVWAGLERKITAAEEFVGGAILATAVESTSADDHGRAVTARRVTFAQGRRTVAERCVAYEPNKVEFHQDDGSKVTNTVSDGAGVGAGDEGDLYMTYAFEWLVPGFQGTTAEWAEQEARWKKMAKTAVESSITAMREMVRDGRIK